MTTNPNTTNPITTSPSTVLSDSCQTVVLDYVVLRKQNFNTINDYYNKLLSNYTSNYSAYTTQTNSSNQNDRTNAAVKLKGIVADLNTQMIAVSKAMIDSVDRDTNLILDQKNQLQTKTTTVDALNHDIKLLKDENDELITLSSSREDSLNSTKTSTDNKYFITYIYIGINILLLCLIIGFICRLIYSSYASSSSSSPNTMNNISRNNMKTNNVITNNVKNNTRTNNTKL